MLRLGQSVYPPEEMSITIAIHSFIFMQFEVPASGLRNF